MNRPSCNICTLEGPSYHVLSAEQLWEQESFACLINALVKCKTCSIIMCYKCIQFTNDKYPYSSCYQRCGTSLDPFDTYNDIKYTNFGIELQSDNDCIRQSINKQHTNITRRCSPIINVDQTLSIQEQLNQYIENKKKTQQDNTPQQHYISVQGITIQTDASYQMFTRKFLNQYKKQLINLDIKIQEDNNIKTSVLLPYLTDNGAIIDKSHGIEYKLELDFIVKDQEAAVVQLQETPEDLKQYIEKTVIQFIRSKMIKMFNKYMNKQLITLNTTQISQLQSNLKNHGIQGVQQLKNEKLRFNPNIKLQSFNSSNSCAKVILSNNGNKQDQQLYSVNIPLLRLGMNQQFVDLLQYRLDAVNVTSLLVDHVKTQVPVSSSICDIQPLNQQNQSFQDINKSYIQDKRNMFQQQKYIYHTQQASCNNLSVISQQVSFSELELVNKEELSTLQQQVNLDQVNSKQEEIQQLVDNRQELSTLQQQVNLDNGQRSKDQRLPFNINRSDVLLQQVRQDQSFNANTTLNGLNIPNIEDNYKITKRRKLDEDSEYICSNQQDSSQDDNGLEYEDQTYNSHLFDRQTGTKIAYQQYRKYDLRQIQTLPTIQVKMELQKQINKSLYDQYCEYVKLQMMQQQLHIDVNSIQYIQMKRQLSTYVPIIHVTLLYDL